MLKRRSQLVTRTLRSVFQRHEKDTNTNLFLLSLYPFFFGTPETEKEAG